jgi:dipeptidase E
MATNQLLLLSSGSFLITHPKVFKKPFSEMKMVYIPTAAKGATDQSSLERRRKMFSDQNYSVTEFDLDNKNEKEVREALSDCEIIFVGGGNSFYLLNAIKKSGFDTVIPELLESGVIYMGSSAGAYVACPTIEMATWKHQDTYSHFDRADLKALNLVPFIATAHFKEEYRNLLREKIKESQIPVRILTDEQALLVKGDTITLIGSGEEILT